MPEVTNQKKFFWGTFLLTFLILILVGFFVWRIVYYMNLFRAGKLADLREAEAREMSISRLAAAAAATTNLSPLSLDGEPSLGNVEALLTIVVFADFSCPYSRETAFVMRSIMAQNSGGVRYVYKDFPLIDLHSGAESASEAAACAGDQDKFWEMHDRLYLNQSDFSRLALLEHARVLDLEMGRFISCLDGREHAEEIEADYQEGLAAGVFGTPTFFFNNEKVQGSLPADILRGVVEKYGSVE